MHLGSIAEGSALASWVYRRRGASCPVGFAGKARADNSAITISSKIHEALKGAVTVKKYIWDLITLICAFLLTLACFGLVLILTLDQSAQDTSWQEGRATWSVSQLSDADWWSDAVYHIVTAQGQDD